MGGTVARSPGPLDEFPRIIYIDLRVRNSQKLHNQGEPNIMPKRTWTIEDQDHGLYVDQLVLRPGNVGGVAAGYSGRQPHPAGRTPAGALT